MKRFFLLVLAASLAFAAGDPAGFHIWKAAELNGLPAALSAQSGASTSASAPLANLGNYSFTAILRKATAAAEVHETQNDIFVITSGEAVLVVGGSLTEPKTTQEHEIRGTSITGGVEKKLAPGDVVTIPAGMAHQLKVEAGHEICYIAIKVAK